jgi:uncharacterized membrane protein YeaQ/YmgE (transglycosylase-associated protein family)
VIVAAYIVIGLVAGVLAARYEYRDGTIGGSIITAGVVGMFVALFWPAVAVMLLFGLITKATTRGRTRP